MRENDINRKNEIPKALNANERVFHRALIMARGGAIFTIPRLI